MPEVSRIYRKLPVLAAFLAILVFSPKAVLADNCCVGYIHLERVIGESTIGKAAGAQFQKELAQREAEVKKLLDEVKKLKTFIETRGHLLNESDLKAKYGEYDKAVALYQKEFQAADSEMKRKDVAIMKAILEKIDPIMQKVAQERGFLLLIKDPGILGYVHPSADISSEVLKRLEAQTAATKP
ncbi:MAG: OmpH family outer membrane protein [Deltaproteobacteria bacterium]|nr:OmpH family outer membrane protein [Deltaproteobacteria bacterium]